MSSDQAIEQLKLIDLILSNPQLSTKAKISHLEMLRFPLKHVQSITKKTNAKMAKQRKNESKQQNASKQDASKPRMRGVRGARGKNTQYHETCDYGEHQIGEHILVYPLASAEVLTGSAYAFEPQLNLEYDDTADAWTEAPILVDPSMHPSRYTYLQKLQEGSPVSTVSVQQAHGYGCTIASSQHFSAMTPQIKQEEMEEESIRKAVIHYSQIQDGQINEVKAGSPRDDTVPILWKDETIIGLTAIG